MEKLGIFVPILLMVISQAAAQTHYRVCAKPSDINLCQAVDRDDSRVSCVTVDTSVDCALKLAAGDADFGKFSEEEVLLMAQQQLLQHRVVGSIKHLDKVADQFAFEAVAVVPASYTGGLTGLRRVGFCHPGFDNREVRWSPRVLKTFEQRVAQTDRECNGAESTPEGQEASAVERFFGDACRPGSWSEDSATDAALKARFPSLCKLCGNNGTCDSYAYANELVAVSGQSTNAHILALQCLYRGSGGVAYSAWQHAREFFGGRGNSTSYGVLCQDGSVVPFSAENLVNTTAPCSWVKQPWSAIVASSATASSVLADLKTWFPQGRGPQPQDNSWISSLDQILFSEPSDRLIYRDALPLISNYSSEGRPNSEFEQVNSCLPAQRWCTTSALEQLKCEWIQRAALTLGVEPRISCVQRTDIFSCLGEIKDSTMDFISADTNYGYLARQRYQLSSAMLVQNSRRMSSRVVALLKEDATGTRNITRFENLRDKNACFPEYGGIAWVSFIRAAHERGIISETQCDYPLAVSEYFSGACAPGAIDAHHTITSGVDVSKLCSACRGPPSTVVSTTPALTPNETCSANYNNYYYATNGTLACIAANHTDVAFIETQYLSAYFTAQNLSASNFRVLCRNNTLAAYTGVDVDDACLLAFVVDGEVLARRSEPSLDSLRSLLRSLDSLFGYTSTNQLINLKIYSPFNGVGDLLFRDTAVGLAEPSNTVHEQAANFVDLFKHLESCTGAAPGDNSNAHTLLPMLTLALATFAARALLF